MGIAIKTGCKRCRRGVSQAQTPRPSRPFGSGRNDEGVTLLELVFAAAIMTIGLVFIAGALITVTNQSKVAGAKVSATNLSNGIIESMRGRDLTGMLTYNSDGSELNIGEDGYIVIEGLDAGGAATLDVNLVINGDNGLVRYDIPMSGSAIEALGDVANPVEIEVVVSIEAGGGQSYNFRSSSLLYY